MSKAGGIISIIAGIFGVSREVLSARVDELCDVLLIKYLCAGMRITGYY